MLESRLTAGRNEWLNHTGFCSIDPNPIIDIHVDGKLLITAPITSFDTIPGTDISVPFVLIKDVPKISIARGGSKIIMATCTEFTNGIFASIIGDGIKVNDQVIISDNKIQLTISVTNKTTLGYHPIIFSVYGGQGSIFHYRINITRKCFLSDLNHKMCITI